MTKELYDLEKIVKLGLPAQIKSFNIKFNHLTIEVEIEDIVETILFLKT